MVTLVTSSPPRPWLALFRTDFVALADDACRRAADGSCADSEEGDDNLRRDTSNGTTGNRGLLFAAGHTSASTKLTSADAADETPLSANDSPNLAQLPTEVLRNIFSRLDAGELSRAAQTCIHYRAVAYEPALWREIACTRIWPEEDPAMLARMLWTPQPPRREFQTWRRLVIHRPHMRFSGIYVRRHQYAKSRRGVVADPADASPVFLVTYFRLLRFFPDGTVLSLTTPEPPDRAYRRLRPGWAPAPSELNKMHPSQGTYHLVESSQVVTITLPIAQDKVYPDMMNGVQYLTVALGSTHAGAFNRLYLRDHFALMDNGELVSYEATHNESSWRFVPFHGFRTKVYDHFPKEATADGRLANWPALRSSAAQSVFT